MTLFELVLNWFTIYKMLILLIVILVSEPFVN